MLQLFRGVYRRYSLVRNYKKKIKNFTNMNPFYFHYLELVTELVIKYFFIFWHLRIDLVNAHGQTNGQPTDYLIDSFTSTLGGAIRVSTLTATASHSEEINVGRTSTSITKIFSLWGKTTVYHRTYRIKAPYKEGFISHRLRFPEKTCGNLLSPVSQSENSILPNAEDHHNYSRSISISR